jgi:DNA replication and repair protein RecF
VDLIEYDADWARLDAQCDAGERTIKIEKQGPATKKTLEVDGQHLMRIGSNRMLPIVLFEPNHLLLLSGSPDLRRVFLDDLIEQSVPSFGATRRHYKRVLAQRNALLKRNPVNITEQLFVWNIRLGELAGQIVRLRLEFMQRLNADIGDLYADIAGQHNKIMLRYVSRFNQESYESELVKALEANIELDVLRGFTAYGPHRDDMTAFIDDHAMQDSASRGEVRTLVLALKILELRILSSLGVTDPLLLLDDVFSELDNRRREMLTRYVGVYQTFITTTDADVVKSYFSESNIVRLPR